MDEFEMKLKEAYESLFMLMLDSLVKPNNKVDAILDLACDKAFKPFWVNPAESKEGFGSVNLVKGKPCTCKPFLSPG